MPLQCGEMIMFPSAAITHGNLPLSEDAGQVRYSLTSYTAASLFRWVANGGVLGTESGESQSQRAVFDWESGWDLFTKLGDIRDELNSI